MLLQSGAHWEREREGEGWANTVLGLPALSNHPGAKVAAAFYDDSRPVFHVVTLPSSALACALIWLRERERQTSRW